MLENLAAMNDLVQISGYLLKLCFRVVCSTEPNQISPCSSSSSRESSRELADSIIGGSLASSELIRIWWPLRQLPGVLEGDGLLLLSLSWLPITTSAAANLI